MRGYRSDEFTALGVDFADRFAMLDESVALMKRLWTEDHVTHTGRFWQLEDARPHIQPWQEPHPPLWVGAMGPVGVRRSARLGDGWPVTPETKIPDMVRLLSLYEDERERLGKPQVRHPLRREIVPAATTDAAFERFEYMAKERLVAYAQRQLATRDAGELTSSFREVAAKETFIGTPDECVAQIRELAAVVPDRPDPGPRPVASPHRGRGRRLPRRPGPRHRAGGPRDRAGRARRPRLTPRGLVGHERQ